MTGKRRSRRPGWMPTGCRKRLLTRKSSSPFSFDFGGGKGRSGRFLLPIAAAVFALFVIAVLLMNGGGRGRMLIIDELFRENLISLLNAGAEIETMSSRGSTRTGSKPRPTGWRRN